MQVDEIQDFITTLHTKIVARDGEDTTKNTLYMLAKISEESGELSRAVLGYYGKQRIDVDRDPIGDIGAECADVIFAVMMLAKNLDIDIQAHIYEKMQVIAKRYED